MKRSSIFLISFFSFAACFSQKITKEQYIQTYKDFAIREMKRMGVPAAITLAQGILETESGNSELVKKSNNHFGIKCKSSWTAGGVSHDDDAVGECFRTYKDAEGSYRDHSNYLRGNSRYAFLFKLDPQDYKSWARGLKSAGYATNPRYPEMLIKHIEDNNLHQYTMLAINDVPVFDASKYSSDPEDKADNFRYNDIVKGKGASENSTHPISSSKKETEINGLKVVYEAKGRSLLAIATEYNINLNRLLEYNDMEKDGLLGKDQYIFLEKKSKTGDLDYYTVQHNETLYDIAQRAGIRLQNLYEYNALEGHEMLTAGTQLKLKPGLKRLDEVAEIPTLSNVKLYSVQPREGLFAISKKYGVTIAQLKEWNNLTDDSLQIGQQLIVSK